MFPCHDNIMISFLPIFLQERSNREEKAAIVLQSHYRGQLGRKNYLQRLWEKFEQVREMLWKRSLLRKGVTETNVYLLVSVNTQSWFTNPDRHCGIWITWLIGRTEVDRDCSLQALARCCRQTTCHIDMTEWAQIWLDSARRPCQCSANDNKQARTTWSPKHKALGDWSYMVHRPSRFPEIMHRWKLWICFLSNIPHQNFFANRAIKPPSHIIGRSFVMLLVGPGGKN